MAPRPLYLRLLSRPGVLTPAALSAATRIASAATSFSELIFFYRHYGSFAATGAVAASIGIGYALSTPLEGRWIDRHGARSVLTPMALLWGGFSLLCLLLAGEATPLLLLLPVSFLAGFFTPSTSSVMRAIWRATSPDDHERVAALAFESVTAKVCSSIGPALSSTALLFLGAGQASALFVLLAATSCAAFGLKAGSLRPAREKHERGHVIWPLLLPVLLVVALYTLGTGMIDVAVASLLHARNELKLAGLVYAAIPLGGTIGGLSYGAWRRGQRDHRRDLIWIFSILIAVWLASAAVSSTLLLFVPLLFIVGVFTAPQSPLLFDLGGRAARGAETEAIGWVTMTMALFYGLGRPVSGAISDHFGGDVTLYLVAVPLSLALVLTLALRRSNGTDLEQS